MEKRLAISLPGLELKIPLFLHLVVLVLVKSMQIIMTLTSLDPL